MRRSYLNTLSIVFYTVIVQIWTPHRVVKTLIWQKRCWFLHKNPDRFKSSFPHKICNDIHLILTIFVQFCSIVTKIFKLRIQFSLFTNSKFQTNAFLTVVTQKLSAQQWESELHERPQPSKSVKISNLVAASATYIISLLMLVSTVWRGFSNFFHKYVCKIWRCIFLGFGWKNRSNYSWKKSTIMPIFHWHNFKKINASQ